MSAVLQQSDKKGSRSIMSQLTPKAAGKTDKYEKSTLFGGNKSHGKPQLYKATSRQYEQEQFFCQKARQTHLKEECSD